VKYRIMNIELTNETEKDAIRQAIHDVIRWALNKDFDLLYSVVTQDEDFFIFHPDSKSTITGFDAFKSFAKRSWTDPAFKATRFEIKELKIHLSRSGNVAWYSCFLDDFGEWDGKEVGWTDARWTGVLEKRDERWLIAQMHFSFPTDRKET
jgi:ketosteroid isomerase-like protein